MVALGTILGLFFSESECIRSVRVFVTVRVIITDKAHSVVFKTWGLKLNMVYKTAKKCLHS